MLQIEYSDDQLINLLGSDLPQERNKAITVLFNDQKFRSQVMAYLMRKGTQKDDAIDLFKDALISLSLSIKKGNYKGNNDLRSYLFGICKYLWLNKVRKKNIIDYKEELPDEDFSDNAVTKLYADDNKQLIAKLMDELKKPCRQILMLWSYGYKFVEIAEKVGYGSEGMARKKKHQCWQSFLTLINGNEEIKLQLKAML